MFNYATSLQCQYYSTSTEEVRFTIQSSYRRIKQIKLAYVYGNPRNWPFEHWINQSPNVVIVSVYYRLDSFGFLTHPSFSHESLGDHNVGLHDQILGLRWVHEHIAAFGGDPEKVTLVGQSAGAGSVMLHLTTNGYRDLFHAAIVQSTDREVLPYPAQQEVPYYAHQIMLCN